MGALEAAGRGRSGAVDARTEGWGTALPEHVTEAVWLKSTGTLTMSIRIDGGERVDLSSAPVKRLIIRPKGNAYDALSPTTASQQQLVLPPDLLDLEVNMSRGAGQAHFKIAGAHRRLSVRVRGGHSRYNRLVLENFRLNTLSASKVSLDIRRRTLEPGETRAIIASLRISSSTVSLNDRALTHLGLTGNCSLRAQNSTISNVVVNGRASLSGEMVGSNLGLLYRGHASAKGMDLVIKSETCLEFQRVRDMRIAVVRNAELVVAGEARGLTLAGPGILTVGVGASDVAFLNPTPRLRMCENAQLVDASGSVQIIAARHASIIGKESSEKSSGANSGTMLNVTGVSKGEDLSGLSLSNFRVPLSITGLQILDALSGHAAQVSPSLHAGLPGLMPGTWRRIGWRRTVSHEMAINSQIATALASLAAEKAESGAVRTKLAWCAYRMRNISAAGRAERVLLSLYRGIGYGERPGPAMLTYVALAIMMASIALSGNEFVPTVDGLHLWIKAVGDWLIAPVHVLKLTGEAEPESYLPQPWDTLARLIIALPLATAALALRKYVKSERKAR